MAWMSCSGLTAFVFFTLNLKVAVMMLLSTVWTNLKKGVSVSYSEFSDGSGFPVLTQRCFNVYTTSKTLGRRRFF